MLSAGLITLVRLQAQEPETSAEVLFRNVRVFDGKSPRLLEPTDVLIQGNTIAAVGPIPTEGKRLIEGAERTLMPGLIDAHWRSTFVSLRPAELLAAKPATRTSWQVPRPLRLSCGASRPYATWVAHPFR